MQAVVGAAAAAAADDSVCMIGSHQVTNPARTVECNHVACYRCMLTALQTSNRCPYCQTRLTVITHSENDAGRTSTDVASIGSAFTIEIGDGVRSSPVMIVTTKDIGSFYVYSRSNLIIDCQQATINIAPDRFFCLHRSYVNPTAQWDGSGSAYDLTACMNRLMFKVMNNWPEYFTEFVKEQ